MSALGRVLAAPAMDEFVHRLRKGEPPEDQQRAIDELLPEGKRAFEFGVRFATLTSLSAGVAGFGLLSNSGAVVIGAMLLAPLMTPIAAGAAALVLAENRRFVRALGLVTVGTVVAIAVGWFVAWMSATSFTEIGEFPTEVESRTFPGLLDLGVAITAGAAAGYILPRRSVTSALPGVGISVALVPPLTVVGIVARSGLWDEARNAFLLFLTNLAAITFAVAVMLLLAGFRPHQDAGRRLARRMSITTLAVLAVAAPLTIHTFSVIEAQRLDQAVREAAEEWDDEVRIVDLSTAITSSGATVELSVSGNRSIQPVWLLAQTIHERYEGPVELRLRFQTEELFVSVAR